MGPPPNEPEAVPAGLAIPPADWQPTPPSVKTLVMGLLKRLEALEARLNQDAPPSHRPPSTDSPYTKSRKPSGRASARRAGGQPGHPGPRQRLLGPTDTQVVMPAQCACGNTALARPRPSYTPQVIELPPIHMAVTHFVLQPAWGPLCAQWTKAPVAPEHATGYGPRLTALMGEIAGPHGTSRRTLQTLCASVLQGPLSLGAMQKMLDRVAQALAPHDAAIAQQARQAPVHDIDETPWLLTTTLQWLWVMARDPVAFYMLHPQRSKEAFTARIAAWTGLLVRAGAGV